MVKRWLPEHDAVAVGDSSFAVLDLRHSVREKVPFITRLRLDAALSEAAPERLPGQNGRPRKKGNRLPSLKAIAENRATQWRPTTVRQWSGAGAGEVKIVSATCVWSGTGLEAVPIRDVLIREAAGKFKTQALLSTDLSAAPEQILEWFVWHWQISKGLVRFFV